MRQSGNRERKEGPAHIYRYSTGLRPVCSIKFNLSSDGNLLYCSLAELQAMQRNAIGEIYCLNKYPLSLYYIGGDNGL